MSEDTDWIATCLQRGTVTRRDLELLLFSHSQAMLLQQTAARRRLEEAEEKDRREWIGGVRSRLGLVTEVHKCQTWMVGRGWWAWACLRPGCPHADWQRYSHEHSASSQGVASGRAAAHVRKFLPAAPEPVSAPGAGLDLTGFGPNL